MELSKEVLRRRYSRFSDQALLAARAAGPKPYSPLAWEVIQRLVYARGLSAAPAPPTATPEAGGPAQSAPTRAASPNLLVSRLRGPRWPVADPLPLAARNIFALAALIYGIAALVLVIVAFGLRGRAAAGGADVPELGVASLLSLAFAYSARRPPSPTAWRFAMLYCGASPAVALAQTGTATAPDWPQLLLGGLVGVLWLLYFARRRTTYGLSPWNWSL